MAYHQFYPTFTVHNPDFKQRIQEVLKTQYFMKYIHFELTYIDAGYIEGWLTLQDIHKQGLGFLHGGVTATLCDIVTGFAAFSLVPQNQYVVTGDLKVSYLNPAVGPRIQAIGKVLKQGKMLTFCEAEIWNINENTKTLCAIANAIMVNMDLPSTFKPYIIPKLSENPVQSIKVAVDNVVFGWNGEEIHLLLVKRNFEPYRDKWALPGGFIEYGENAEKASLRKLFEETSIEKVFLEQLYTFSDKDRDPRMHVISIAYYALINMKKHQITQDKNMHSSAIQWVDVRNIPPLAFDHNQIVDTALQRLKSKITYTPIGFELLPDKFTLSELQLLYEKILNRKIDKRNFRKKILSFGMLEPLQEYQKNVRHRAAQYYRFNPEKYAELSQKGIHFEI
ncbi:MAG: NUDIX domain-containing protein [Bacteroidia bacterium]|nr:NUDIX domain-containing protein [Bacteroidia bacterium]